ncbi:hypothetical protein ACOCJ5_01235 [Knoellia sp. CPCC 206450]|uniref:hypothetical protein n=1 Tax=Knoellia tibetensis TaxID=3404798 RepID=UPI003B433C9A
MSGAGGGFGTGGGAGLEDASREVEAILAELLELRHEIDAERDELVEQFVSDPSTDHRGDYEQMSDKARAGELGPEWQRLQRRVDLDETSLDRVFSGDDTSSEAEFVRGVAEEKAGKILELQVEPDAERDLELNMSTFAAVRAEQAEILRMLSEIRGLPLPPLD